MVVAGMPLQHPWLSHLLLRNFACRQRAMGTTGVHGDPICWPCQSNRCITKKPDGLISMRSCHYCKYSLIQLAVLGETLRIDYGSNIISKLSCFCCYCSFIHKSMIQKSKKLTMCCRHQYCKYIARLRQDGSVEDSLDASGEELYGKNNGYNQY